MQLALDIASWALILGGVAFCLIGGYGLLRLQDVYARLHAASLIDTLGVGLVLVGLMLQAGWTLVTAKLFLILIFIFFTTPTATHALAKSAINHDVLPEVDSKDELDLVRAAKTPGTGGHQ